MRRKLTVTLLAGVICLLGVTSAWAVKYNEAPMLRVKVAAGELPPVEERLPEEPMVIEPFEEIGQYGGTALQVHAEANNLEPGCVFSQSIFVASPDGTTILPNIAKSWEFSEEGKVLTLYLRKGIKWSDGAPFTADDILFWYEDKILNDELTPVEPRNWSPGGKLMEMEKVDDYTVRLRFAVPYPVALNYLVHYYGYLEQFYLPKHYLKQWHPHYVPKEKIEKLAKEAGYDFWFQLFQKKANSNYSTCDPYYPVLRAYVVKENKLGDVLLERNPYFWKVDTEGNQLPYIDYYFDKLVENNEAAVMRIVSGEVDFSNFHATIENYPLFRDNEDKGNYRVLLWKSNIASEVVFFPNLTHKDPVFRKIFQDRRFRFALSLAMNREELNETICFGKGKPTR